MGDLLQLDLFPDLTIEPTRADHQAGATRLAQCSNCGLLVAAPDCASYKRTDPLGECPRCGPCHWWRQEIPVGPFGRPGDPSSCETCGWTL